MGNIVLKKLKVEDFGRIYKDMLEQFPICELKSYDVFEKLLTCNKLIVEGAFDNNVEIGYVIYSNCKDSIWLDYIAIKKKFHSKGYGSKILSLLDNCYLEVEKLDKNKPDTLRRIKFYTSLGAEKLELDYYYPNKDGCLPMDLYFLGEKIPNRKEVLSTIELVFENLHSDIEHYKTILAKIGV